MRDIRCKLGKMMLVVVRFIGLICLINQTTIIYATTGASFLKIGIGARPIGMGSAFTAVADDVTALHWNPAGLSQLLKPEISVMHTEWIVDTKLNFVGYAQPIGNSVIGISAIYLSQGRFEGRNENREITNNFAANDLAITMAYSRQLAVSDQQLVNVGINLKLIRQQIETRQATGIASDFGLLTRISLSPFRYPLTVGFSIRNIGPQMRFISEYYNLPLTLVGGFSYRIKRVNLALDIKHQIYGNKTDISFGTEYLLFNVLALRLGYSSYQISPNLSAGIGIKLFNIQTDYSFVPYGILGNTHRISFSAKF